MQQIERYGVIALVFFLIMIVAVSFWGDSKSPGFWSRLTGREKKDAIAEHILPPQSSTDKGLTAPAPLDTDPQRTLFGEGPQTPQSQDALADHKAESAPQNNQQEPFVSNAPPVQPKPASAPSEYVVQKGDSLARIARVQLGKESRWPEIEALNPGVSKKSLKVGAKLMLPSDAGPAVAKLDTRAAPPAKAPEAGTKPKTKPEAKPELAAAPAKKAASAHTCTVGKGETLQAIASRELGDKDRWKEIVELNPGISPTRLPVGAVLRLPEGSRATEVAELAPRAKTTSSKPAVR